jgi:hypothetical protein
MFVLRRIDLTGKLKTHDTPCANHDHALELLEAARKKRGPWREDPTVHGIVEVQT